MKTSTLMIDLFFPEEEEDRQLPRIDKVISGGQTGADRAGLEAARELGIPTGGWAPPGFQTISGRDVSLAAFGLKEIDLNGPKSQRTMAAAYVARSKMNVDSSDATVAFRLHKSVGTDKTIQYCSSGQWGKERASSLTHGPHRPCFVIASLDERKRGENLKAFRQFLIDHNVRTLNVIGHRKAPDECPTYNFLVKQFLKDSLK